MSQLFSISCTSGQDSSELWTDEDRELKYNRLKPTIINNLLFSSATKERLETDFKKIFSFVLKDRALVGTNVTNQFGLISIQIKELADGRIFDIDQMNSGEKGLILTFLLISNSLAEDAIILVDEPELHLNPAVCKLLLPFLIDEIFSTEENSGDNLYSLS